MSDLWPLLILGAAGWLWYANLRAREVAVRVARETCDRQNLQLLDSTVVLKSTRLRRQPAGQLALQRAYQFEYSESGANRQRGFIILSGRRIDSIGLARQQEIRHTANSSGG